MRHESHPQILKRLKRADGHLRAVIAMIEEAKPCIDIAQQLQAVESAIHQAKKSLIHDHLDHCLDAAVSSGSVKKKAGITEFKTITKYL